MKVSYLRSEKIKVGIFGFTGCAGDQLVIIHDEDHLLEYFNNADIRSFIMASSASDDDCDLDVAFVEGSINTEHEKEELIEIRKRARLLVAIGNCACNGGVQAMSCCNESWKKMYDNIYGDKVTITRPFEPQPAWKIVDVDLMIPGCPVDKDVLYHAFSNLVMGVPPDLPKNPVCVECKWKENSCLLERGILCLGPITNSGCGAACPSHGVACMGCFGMYKEANLKSFLDIAIEKGIKKEDVIRRIKIHGGVQAIEKLQELEQGPAEMANES